VAAIAALPADKRNMVKVLMQEGLDVVNERDREAREAVTRTAKARNDNFKQRDAAPWPSQSSVIPMLEHC